jgi:uncharacterized small protein (DUF1192 family)
MAKGKKKEAPWMMLVDHLGMSEKDAKKVTKSLHVSENLIEDVKALSVEALEQHIAHYHTEIQRTTEEVEENKAYIEAVEVVKTFKSSLREATSSARAYLVLKTHLLRQIKDKR